MIIRSCAVAHMSKEKCIKTGFSCPLDLLEQLDERANSLRLNRSQYLRLLVEEDVARGGARTITPSKGNQELN